MPAGDGGGDASTDPDAKIELTLATFNNFGYTDELLQEYMDANPNVTIVHNKAAESADARANYFQKLGKEGLADVEAVEIDWFAEAMQYSDLLAEVPDSAKGRWLDWKEAGATDGDGRLVGYGTDIGPQAICYRADLFEAAGLPSTPDEVATLFDGDWANFFDVADQYKAATGKPMIDAAQLGAPGHREPAGVHLHRARWHRHRDGEPRGRRGLQPRRRAGHPERCVLGPVERRLERLDGQRRVRCDALPRLDARRHLGQRSRRHRLGGRQCLPERRRQLGWVVPDRPRQRQERRGSACARRLADRSRAAGQDVRQRWTVPERDRGSDDPAITDSTNEYFNNAPTGQIFAERSEAITVTPYKDADYFKYHDALQNAVNRVFDGVEDQETSWNTWVTEVSAF